MNTKVIVKRMLIYILRLILISILSIILWYLFCPQPELKSFTSYSTAFFDKSGKLLKLSLAKDERYRLYQDYEQLSPTFIKATLLYEDKSYYQHYGVDFPALLNAFWETYVKSERRIGASTITMQVARLRWNMNTTTISGKIQQIFRAIQLSRHYSKSKILEAYFNIAPYGGNIEGIGAASLIYFNKLPSQLSFPEALTLAVIPQNPNDRNPVKNAGYQKLLTARENLFQRWIERYPADKDKHKYLELPLKVRTTKELPKLAPHFTQYLSNGFSNWHHGNIYSTLDLNQQKKLEKVLKDYVSSKTNIGIKNASALLLNYQTMEIEAMVGSADFYNESIFGQVNGTTAKRSPGSTLKPFVYALALDEGLIHPMSLLKDSPKRYGGFTPENYDKRFIGPIVARDALIKSRNVPAVELQYLLKQKKRSFYDFLITAGVSRLQKEAFYGLALALGGAELTMMELVHLYSLLANKGELRAIVTNKAELKKSMTQNNVGNRILSEEASFLILHMLKDNPAPIALRIDNGYLQKSDIAWKTGTSWAFRDAWAIGVSGPYVLAVWVGNFNGKGNNTFIGRTAAGPLLFSAFSALTNFEKWTVEEAFAPENMNLKKIKVCAKTGDLYQKHCPTSKLTWFIPGVSPIKVSNIYRNISIDKTTGLRTCRSQTSHSYEKVYAFWPSDFLFIFEQAGISLKTPPKFAPECSLDKKSSSGLNPVITSPQSGISYVIQSDSIENRQIPFSVIVDPDVEKIFWFVNGKYEGSSLSGVPFIWQGINGKHSIRAVDDSGRATNKNFTVIQIQ